MLRYFTVSGSSHEEVRRKILLEHGGKAKILNTREKEQTGLKRLLNPHKVIVEYDCIISEGLPEVNREEQKVRDLSEKKKILGMVGKNETEEKILREISTIKETLDNINQQRVQTQHPTLLAVEDFLLDNDFTPRYIKKVMEDLRHSVSIEDLDNPEAVMNKLAGIIGETISVFQDRPAPLPRVFILVGPTGVGKTTTIAKLAATYGITADPSKQKKVRIITIDCYRIGAREQMETYGDIMNIPVAVADNYEELKKQVDLNRDSDLIFIDTIGKSPKDFLKLAEMRKILEACGRNAEIHLAVSATTKASDIREIFSQFEPFHFQSVVLTKMDETGSTGNLISLLHEYDKPVSFFTTGQSVPTDIVRASAEELINKLNGLDLRFDNDKEKVSS